MKKSLNLAAIPAKYRAMRGIIRHRCVRIAGLCLLALGVAANAAEVRSMRVSQTSDATRITFDLSGPVDYKLFEIANPDRIVLDLHAATFVPGFSPPSGDGLLKSVRTGQRDKGDSRVVFDLETGVRPKSFLMPPEHGEYKLVVDLYKKGKSGNQVVKSAKAIEIKPRAVVIAIDAGHGGVDPGATGSGGTHEKDITLAVALDLKRLIDKQPGMSAVLTRDADFFIPLQERFQKARAAKADLFVSIHADAYNSGDARGSSVWMLSSRGATSEAARWLADRENRADLVGGVSLGSKDNTLAAVLLDLSQGATLGSQRRRRSTSVALAVENRPHASRLCRESQLRRTAFARRPVHSRRNRLHHQSHRRTQTYQCHPARKTRRRDSRRRAQLFPQHAAAGQLVRGECAQRQATFGLTSVGCRRR